MLDTKKVDLSTSVHNTNLVEVTLEDKTHRFYYAVTQTDNLEYNTVKVDVSSMLTITSMDVLSSHSTQQSAESDTNYYLSLLLDEISSPECEVRVTNLNLLAHHLSNKF